MSELKNSFDETYWIENYSDLNTMDCIANSKEHVCYAKSTFELEQIEINSIVDFGMGLGFLFNEFLKKFKPYKALGIEPSEYAFDHAGKIVKRVSNNSKFSLKNIDLLTWSKGQKKNGRCFDLGICTSVFQYIPDDDLKVIIPILSKSVKYLYLTVPTDEELDNQINDLEFFDRYALRRTQAEYLDLLKDDFVIVGSRLLESKYHFNQSNSNFTDLLFRF